MSARVYRIGLTGGIACGKSTAAKLFGALGVPILDSDQVAATRDSKPEPGLDPVSHVAVTNARSQSPSGGRRAVTTKRSRDEHRAS